MFLLKRKKLSNLAYVLLNAKCSCIKSSLKIFPKFTILMQLGLMFTAEKISERTISYGLIVSASLKLTVMNDVICNIIISDISRYSCAF